MYTLISQRSEKLSPKRCEELLRLNTFLGQRPMNQRIVLYYRDLMLSGAFCTAEIGIAVMPDGARVLMNGQKTLQAAIQADKTLAAFVEEYACEADADLWHLFGAFDVHQSRTERHVMTAARGLFASDVLRTINLDILASCGSALAMLGDGMKPIWSSRPLKKTDKADLIEKYEDDVLRVAQYGSEAKQYLRVGTCMAIIVTFRKNAKKAQAFWDKVLYGADLTRGTAPHRLHRAINGDIHLKDSRPVDTKMLYRICITWWNSYVKGENRTLAKVSIMKDDPAVQG